MGTSEISDGGVVFIRLTGASAKVHEATAVASTHVVRNVQDFTPAAMLLILDEVGMLSNVDGDINVECFGESHNLHVVSISTSLCHTAQMSLKDRVLLGGGSCVGSVLGSKGTSILPLWVSSSTATGVDLDEVLVILAVGSHGSDDGGTNFLVLVLISIELVGESMKETIT